MFLTISIIRTCRKGIRGTCCTDCSRKLVDMREKLFDSAVLAAAEAVEFGHGAFHFFASGVCGGANTLNAEAEVVRIRSAHESFFESDEVARVEIEARLIECLHAVLAGAGGDG